MAIRAQRASRHTEWAGQEMRIKPNAGAEHRQLAWLWQPDTLETEVCTEAQDAWPKYIPSPGTGELSSSLAAYAAAAPLTRMRWGNASGPEANHPLPKARGIMVPMCIPSKMMARTCGEFCPGGSQRVLQSRWPHVRGVEDGVRRRRAHSMRCMRNGSTRCVGGMPANARRPQRNTCSK